MAQKVRLPYPNTRSLASWKTLPKAPVLSIACFGSMRRTVCCQLLLSPAFAPAAAAAGGLAGISVVVLPSSRFRTPSDPKKTRLFLSAFPVFVLSLSW